MTTRRTFLQGLGTLPVVALPASAVPRGAPVDPIPAFYAEKVRVTGLLNGGQPMTEDEADALMDLWGACDAAAIETKATTPAGAIASIEWARGELLEFGFDINRQDKGARLILALLDGATDVLSSAAVLV